MKFKNISVCILASFLLFTGCTVSKAEESGYQQTNISQEATVSICIPSAYYDSGLREAAKAYMEGHPNVTISLEIQEDGQDYNTWILSRMQNKDNFPTIFCLEGKQDFYDFKEELEDLSDQSWNSHVYHQFSSSALLDGKTGAMPATIEAYGIFYNEALFKAADIRISDAYSMEQLQECLDELHQMLSENQFSENFSSVQDIFSSKDTNEWAETAALHKFLLSTEFSNTTEAYTSPSLTLQYKEPARQLLDMVMQYQTPSEDGTVVDFAMERSALFVGSSTQINEVFSINPQSVNQIAYKAIPYKWDSSENILANVSFYWGIYSQDSIENKKAAKDFLNWLYNSEQGKKHLVNSLQFVSPYTNMDQTAYKDNPISQLICTAAQKDNISTLITGCAPTNFAKGTFTPLLQDYLSGSIEWDDFIAKSVAKWSLLRSQSIT